MEVGGRLVVEGASLTVRARDKVGLVGRNGAGKTSLLRVLGGAARRRGRRRAPQGRARLPAAGPAHRRPARRRAPRSTHVLSGRGLDQATVRIEKLRLAMEEDPSDAQRRPLRPGRGGVPSRTGATPPRARCARSPPGSGSMGDRLDLPLAVLSGGERRRVELARILFAGSDVLLPRRAHQPPRRRRQGVADGVPPRATAARCSSISHDLDLLDEAITRVLHLDRPNEELPGHIVEYKGTYTQYLAARAEDEERLTKIAAQQDAEIKRLSDARRPIRREGDEGEQGAQPRQARRPHRAPPTSRRRRTTARCR